jgi:ribosomal protein S6
MSDADNMLEAEQRRVYELGYILTPELSESDAGAEADRLKEEIIKKSGVVLNEESPKARKLAYQMTRRFGSGQFRKYETGYYGFIKFEIVPSTIVELKSVFDSNEKIIRYLTVKTVRENTQFFSKLRFEKSKMEIGSKPIVKAATDETAAPVSEEELDKKLAELVAD